MNEETQTQLVNINDAEEDGNIVCIDSASGSPNEDLFAMEGNSELPKKSSELSKPRVFCKHETININPEEDEFNEAMGGTDTGEAQSNFDNEFSEFNIGLEQKERKAHFSKIYGPKKYKTPDDLIAMGFGGVEACREQGDFEAIQPKTSKGKPTLEMQHQRALRLAMEGKPQESHLKPEWFMNFTHFPTEFLNHDEALEEYNRLGLAIKIQFRKYSMKKNEQGFTTQFWLSCFKRRPGGKTANGKNMQKGLGPGTKIKESQWEQCHDCPVIVKFKWSKDKMSYCRQNNGMNMWHNHSLELKDKHYLINDPLILKEMDLFVKCKLSVGNIFNIVKKKYMIRIRYQDVYNRVQQIKKDMGMKETEIFREKQPSNTPYHLFVNLLNNEQQKYSNQFNLKGVLPDTPQCKKYAMSWAMQLDAEFAQTAQSNPQAQPKLENISNFILILPRMKENFLRYPDLIFIDTTMKHKIPIQNSGNYSGYGAEKQNPLHAKDPSELNLIILSGINNDGRSVVFGFGFVKETTIDNYKWILNKFSDYMSEASGETGDLGDKKTGLIRQSLSEARVISAYDMNLANALEVTFKCSEHRFCQTSVRDRIAIYFPHDDENAVTQAFKQMLQNLRDLIYVEDPFKFQHLVDIVMGQTTELNLTGEQVMFLRHLISIKQMWASAFSNTQANSSGDELGNYKLDLGMTSLAKASSLNEMIQSRLYARANLTELFKLVQDVAERNEERIRLNNRAMFREEKLHGSNNFNGTDEIQDSYHVRSMVCHNPFLADLRQRCSVYAFEHMLFQYSLSLSYIALPFKQEDSDIEVVQTNQKMFLYDPNVFVVKHHMTNKTKSVLTDCDREVDGYNFVKITNSAAPYEDKVLGSRVTCTCQFFKSFDLLCRHIFAVVNIFQAKTNIFPINKRWLKDEYCSGNLGKFKKGQQFIQNFIEVQQC